jgi:hypothetical protein
VSKPHIKGKIMSPQAGWILQSEIAPRLGSAIPRSVLCVGTENHRELVQDGITMAAKMIDRVEQQGKMGKVSPGNIAYYTLQHLKSGRRATGSSAVCIHGSMTQLNGCAEVHSLSEVVSQAEGGDDIHELNDVISNTAEDPSMSAARKMDWDVFCKNLNRAELTLIKCLVQGLSIKEAAKQARVHYATMQGYRKKLGVKLLEFMGADILKEIAQVPTWRIGLDCEREQLACRAERRH